MQVHHDLVCPMMLLRRATSLGQGFRIEATAIVSVRLERSTCGPYLAGGAPNTGKSSSSVHVKLDTSADYYHHAPQTKQTR